MENTVKKNCISCIFMIAIIKLDNRNYKDWEIMQNHDNVMEFNQRDLFLIDYYKKIWHCFGYG